MAHGANLDLITYGEDALAHLAERLIQDHLDSLPDLTTATVLLPQEQGAYDLRQRLLEAAARRGHSALLGPEITSLQDWVSGQGDAAPALLSPHKRQLLLVEALVEHAYLYGEGSPWALADSLLNLFDEMTARQVILPQDMENFIRQLGRGYGLPDDEHAALNREARLVHTLWQAWHQQLEDAGCQDRQSGYLLTLGQLSEEFEAGHRLYLAGYCQFTQAETAWIKRGLQAGSLYLLLQGGSTRPAKDYHPDAVNGRILTALEAEAEFPPATDPYGTCLNQVYAVGGPDLLQRARETARQYPESPIRPRLAIFEAGSAEEEAQAVELQVRRWFLAGHERIGIVTENRRLARRVRALLERARIPLQDEAGWALSTTSAAAVLERWLETLEEDFVYQPLLDLLKSPFLPVPPTGPWVDREDFLATVYRFEQGVVLQSNVARKLQAYREATHSRQGLLPAELAADYVPIYALLETLEQAAAHLTPLIDAGPQAPAGYLAALWASLQALGLHDSFQQDAAGQRILEELQQMQAAVEASSLRMGWLEFRAWLGRTLENFNFQPSASSGQVQLMSLAQSSLCRFDALILASAERESLPGSANDSPFFNDGVRASLGLPTTPERLSQPYYQFRRLLESAGQVLITRRREQDGEEVVPSPWLELLQSFHHIAYGDDLLDAELEALLRQGDTVVSQRMSELPEETPAQPAPQAEFAMLPRQISASAYQQLMDCPYQFFAAHCLGLQPPESIREMLAKSDYGELVHRCLQAFHNKTAGLPGPFRQPLIEGNREAAIACLEDISQAVFAKDVESHFFHRAWLQRWRELIPHYVDWQMERAQHWRVKATESKLESAISDALSLKGRLDRLDQQGGDMAIIDYKTGYTPHQDDIDAGEAVQLPFYAWLAETATGAAVGRAEYVCLDEGTVKTKGMLEEEALAALKNENARRLEIVIDEMRQGKALPAWGDEISCRYCQMSGLCRRQLW